MRILFISYNHQEPIYADVIQNIRLIKELEKKADIDICCRKTKGNTERYSISSPNLFFFSRILWKFFPFFRFMFDIDAFIWCVLAYRKIRRYVVLYDKIIVSYAPYSIFYLPYWLNRKSGKDVVSILYDSLVENCFFSNSGKAIRVRSKIERNIFSMSRLCAVNNTKYYDALVSKKYNDKLILLPLCGRNEIYVGSNRKTISNKLIISHAGSIHGVRRLKEIIELLDLLSAEVKQIDELVEINIFGRCSDDERSKVNRSGYSSVIQFHNYFGQEELAEKLYNSDVLLLIDPLCEGNFSFPSKICEYTQYDKLILAIAAKDSPSYSFLRAHGHKSFTQEELPDMCYTIKQLLKDKTCFNSEIDYKTKDLFNPANVCDSLWAKI